MKRSVVCILVLCNICSVNLVFSANLGPLPGLLKPNFLIVCSDGVFIFEGATVYMYSIENLSFIRKFGREGEGPGEIKLSPFYSNSMMVFPDSVFVDSVNKILYFSKEGKLIKERKKAGGLVTQMLPVGKNFVVKDLDRSDRKKEYIVISVYDSEMKKIKELFRQESPVQPLSTDMIPDSPHFCVFQNKIFVEESLKGFFIEVFNAKGEKLYQIEKKHEPLKVTKGDKEDVLRLYKADPLIKQIGFENLKRRVKFIYPDLYPVIQSINGFGGRIYVKTFKKMDNKEEYVVMDLKGKELGRIYMPLMEKAPLMARLNGIDLQIYSIHKNKFYYLKENENEEEWELHVQNIGEIK